MWNGNIKSLQILSLSGEGKAQYTLEYYDFISILSFEMYNY